jgi:2EXR family
MAALQLQNYDSTTYWVPPSLPWKKPKICSLPTSRTVSTIVTSLEQGSKEEQKQTQKLPMEEKLSNLSITSESKSERFDLFPAFPPEIRFQIWSQAILDLPERIIPIREISGQKRTQAYFTTSRPHPLFASINREAREAVFSTLQPLFLPGANHALVSVHMKRDVILLCSNHGVIRPKTLTRLQRAMGPRTREDHFHLAAEVQIQDSPFGWGRSHFIPNPRYDVIASMTQLFPDICHLTLVPVQHVSVNGVENYRGELYLGNEEGFESPVKEYYASINKEEYVRRRPFHRVWDEKKKQMVVGPEGPEIRWGCLKLVGGARWAWDPATRKGYWRMKRDNDELG